METALKFMNNFSHQLNLPEQERQKHTNKESLTKNHRAAAVTIHGNQPSLQLTIQYQFIRFYVNNANHQ